MIDFRRPSHLQRKGKKALAWLDKLGSVPLFDVMRPTVSNRHASTLIPYKQLERWSVHRENGDSSLYAQIKGNLAYHLDVNILY